MFHIFKKWLIDKLLNGSFLAKKTLVLLGTKYDRKKNTLDVPWLFLPYTPDGTVDMIPIDSVIDGLLTGMNDTRYDGQTIHLTNPEPPLFKWVLSSLVEDLGYQKVKYFKISPTFFIMSLKALYFICVPLRVKVKSAMCYLPYITRRYYFSHKNNKTVGLSEKIPITREFLRKINLYAKEEIFNKINVE
jgi:hypothetical protein